MINNLFPAVPTDSLYKFMAIFGLVLFTFSIYNYRTKLDQAYSLEALIKYQEKSNASQTVKFENNLEDEKIKYNRFEADYNQFVAIHLFTAVLGLILISLGFYLWYAKIQKYNDLILKKQALKE